MTVIGISSFFCAFIRFSAIMAPSLSDIRIHGYLSFNAVPELPTGRALFNVTAV